ncbi:hypothetical protein [Zunongwangia endophytica]|uniref:Uncharacterized protein n=1 Tax=Zunongwangia endophytica TaxID=1808945 RepID=A0ABV8H8N4_9FLAO|nr:hypothetical protein [Zunongwangia endophytica]MDN3593497.1 hypothetical protein [Zunongwangia endophytica]
MIISRGWGLLGLLIPITILLGGIHFFSDDGNASRTIIANSLIISGILNLFTGIIIHQKSNKNHDLFFMPLSIWGIIWIILGLFIAIGT